MRKLWAITENDLRRIFADREIWINLVVIPVALVFLIGFVNGGFNTQTFTPELARERIDLINNDDGDLGGAVLDALQAEPSLLVCTPDTDDARCRLDDAPLTEALALERARDDITAAFVSIPADFTATARNGDGTASLTYQSAASLEQATPALTAVQTAVGRVGGALVAAEVALHVADDLGEVRFEGYEDEPYAALTFTNDADRAAFRDDVYERAVTIWAENPARVDFAFAEAETADDGVSLIGFRQSVPGMGSMYVMFTVLAGMTALLQERKQWTLQRLVVMPVARWQILGGKMLARFITGMIQYVVVFAVGALIGLRYDAPLALLLLMIAFVAVITALAFLLATFVTTENQAGSLSLFIALTVAPLGGAWWPLEIVPGWMQTAALLNPVGWAMRGFSDLLIYGRGFGAVLLPLAVLYGAAAVLFAAAVARFRYD
jgi:ABC-type multidrug transport system permease subunit